MELTVKGKFDLYEVAGHYRIVVYKKRMAKKLQKLLNYYPGDTVFGPEDEPQFTFSKTELIPVLECLGVQNIGELIKNEKSAS